MKLRKKSIEIMSPTEYALTDFFNTIEVEVKSDLSDWHSVQRELRRGKS